MLCDLRALGVQIGSVISGRLEALQIAEDAETDFNAEFAELAQSLPGKILRVLRVLGV